MATVIPKNTTQSNSSNDIRWYSSVFLLMTYSISLLYKKLYTTFPTK